MGLEEIAALAEGFGLMVISDEVVSIGFIISFSHDILTPVILALVLNGMAPLRLTTDCTFVSPPVRVMVHACKASQCGHMLSRL